MGNKETVWSITDNTQTVLQGLGIKFSRQIYEEVEKIPASLMPYGQIFYKGEEFEYTHGQKPEYGEIEFLLRVAIQNRDATQMIREQQKWAHLIRDGLTVAALNIGDIVSSKLVSRVTTEDVTIDHRAAVSVLEYGVLVRYREL